MEQSARFTPEQMQQLADHLANMGNAFRQQSESLLRFAEVISADIKRLNEQYGLALTNAQGPIQVCINKWVDGISTADRFGDIDFAVGITGKAKSTIYNLVSKGKLQAVKNGGQLRFAEEVLKAFANQPRAVGRISIAGTERLDPKIVVPIPDKAGNTLTLSDLLTPSDN
ncbi:helix-turn-helix domain-containing protein [Spirosoma sp. HMF4905]|uniref:Helix-turn-helix domain-containing protein n=1 Tax=Spirosoma arboris TaxID=2682092 RepID=A0A7K1S4B6_9BACT|nr:helix-turn-helix domain-containing protein [Spirosoma arboris]MVM28408.1 helix-turn-helix domain-containing protein [Spirosoma arboris]